MDGGPIAVVRALYDAYNRRNWAAALPCIADGCEWQNMATGWTYRSGAEVVAGMQRFTTAFPDLRVELTNVIRQGDALAFEWRGQGTLQQPLHRPEGWYAPTGRSFTQYGCCVAEVRDSRIVRCRDYFDGESLRHQLGLSAPRPAPPAVG
ncbi:MAG TPA: ester cyclase [Chloroflexota bacterium]|nr:ester cyclase [Chloroflexota bacterium]